ncbi:TPA: hypothetical protein MIH58_24055 [Klebsiella pneumoniae]|nr:hypothetical protein [Klebsiella pneumoniae]
MIYSTKPPIYHNVFLRAPRKRPQGVSDGKPVKQATNHPKTARNAPDLFYAHAWLCTPPHSR